MDDSSHLDEPLLNKMKSNVESGSIVHPSTPFEEPHVGSSSLDLNQTEQLEDPPNIDHYDDDEEKLSTGNIDELISSTKEDDLNLYFDVELNRERFMHALSATHYQKVYDKFLFLPAILLSMISGVFAFAASGDLGLGDGTKRIFNASVGILSLVSVFMQSLTKQLNYSGKASSHESAAVQLKKLQREVKFKSLTKASDPREKAKKSQQGEDKGDKVTAEEEEDYKKKRTYFNQLYEKYLQSTSDINSILPPRIAIAFRSIESEIELFYSLNETRQRLNKAMKDKSQEDPFADNPPVTIGQRKIHSLTRLHKEKLKLAAYNELESVIIASRGWPFIVPRPEITVKKTIVILQEKIDRIIGQMP